MVEPKTPFEKRQCDYGGIEVYANGKLISADHLDKVLPVEIPAEAVKKFVERRSKKG